MRTVAAGGWAQEQGRRSAAAFESQPAPLRNPGFTVRLGALIVAFGAALIFGGTSRGGVAGAAAAFASLPLLALLLPQLPKLLRISRPASFILAAALAIPLLQLIPLPPAIWTLLPGRAPLVETYQAAGLPLPWLGVSVSAHATGRALLVMLSAATIFLGVLGAGRSERRVLWAMVAAAGAASTLLEILQLLDGPDSALRFYKPSDASAGLGLFANRNHTAAMLYCAVPLAALLLPPPGRRPLLSALSMGGYGLAILLGLMMTGSRAGLILGLLSFALTIAFVLRERLGAVWSSRGRRLALGALALAALPLAFAFGLADILVRFLSSDGGPGDRMSLARVSFSALAAFFPFGAGLGGFDRAFPLFQPTEAISPAIVNHAHDDLLEWAIEAGAAGIVVLAGAIWLYVARVRANLREPDIELRRERMAAAIVLGLLFAHSLVDYPLRMPALAAVFAACAATLCAAGGPQRRAGSRSAA